MLHIINDPTNKLLAYVKDDPVRPDLTTDFRITSGRIIIAMGSGEKPDAMTCISFHQSVPDSVDSLQNTAVIDSPVVAVFYTIWSYTAGSGAVLLLNAVKEIQNQFPSISRFVTLSPKTPLARRFHLKNGATIFRENEDSVNYEYISK